MLQRTASLRRLLAEKPSKANLQALANECDSLARWGSEKGLFLALRAVFSELVETLEDYRPITTSEHSILTDGLVESVLVVLDTADQDRGFIESLNTLVGRHFNALESFKVARGVAKTTRAAEKQTAAGTNANIVDAEN